MKVALPARGRGELAATLASLLLIGLEVARELLLGLQFLRLGSREGAAELGPDQTTQLCAREALVRAEAGPGN